LVDLAAAYHRLPGNGRGALWMLASALTFTVMTTLVKYLGEGYGASVQAFYRGLAGVIFLLPIIARDPKGSFRTTRPGILIFRALAGTLGLILAFYSYQEMPLAEANALSFTRTLWVVPLAALVLGEKVGPVRIGATLVGFIGVLVMLRPSGDMLVSWPALAALASAALFAMTVTGMKLMTRDHSATVLIVWSAVFGAVLALPPALFEWRWPSLVDFALLCAMGGLGLITQTCYIRGMALGDAAAMAPLDYTRLIFAVIVGLVFFSEVPNSVTMLGAGIVIASTLYITIREARQKPQPPPE
jgi:drug/metabolite transporter (DMT)-like permease